MSTSSVNVEQPVLQKIIMRRASYICSLIDDDDVNDHNDDGDDNADYNDHDDDDDDNDKDYEYDFVVVFI